MSETTPAPAAGDPCPNCGGAFVAHRAPTDAERAAATNRENPVAYPPRVDSATAEQIAELGGLHVCGDCGYQTRIGATLDEQVEARDEKSGRKAKRT